MADVRELSTDPAVKLSGVAAQTTDNATVVALSPNSNAVSVVSQPELVTTGTITTTDIVVAAPTGNGVLLTGTPTAGSYVAALATGGNASVVIGITGLTSGTLYYEGSADSTTGVDGNWIALNMKQAGIVNTQISSSATANGLYRGNTAGIRYIRMRSVGALTGTPAVTLRLSAGVAGEFLFGSIPTGTNNIGSMGANTAVVSAVTVMQNAVAVTGNGVNLPVTGYGTAVLQVSGTFVASINFEASIDAGVTWTAISATQVGFGDIFSVVTTPGTFRLTTTGLDLIRARVTWTSGTSVTINGRSTNAINASKIVKLATGANTIGAVRLTDGTNVPAVKASGVAAVTTDNALVVALSPNNLTPAVADLTVTAVLSAVNANATNPSTLAPTAASTITLPTLNSTSSVKVTVNGVANSITLQPQVTLDGSTWWNLSGSSCLYTTGVFAGTVSLNGLWDIAIPACVGFRLTCTALGATNTATVVMRSSSGNQVFSSPNAVVYLAAGTNSFGTVQQAALTKGTQGATGVSTQDLKDSGRVSVVINCYQAPGIITTEALFAAATFSLTRDGGTPTTGQQFTVTTGKRFRLQAVMLGIKNTAAAAGTSKLVLRYAAAGGVLTNTSPIALLLDFGSNATVANAYIGPGQYEVPDGLELLSASTYGFTVLSSAITMLHTITLIGYEY